MTDKIPKSFKGTPHQWRVRKRAELRAAKKALDVVRYGCLYLPGTAYEAVIGADLQIERAIEECRPARWGR